MNVLERAVQFYVELLNSKGINSAKRDVELLVGFGLNLKDYRSYLNTDRILSKPEQLKIDKLIRRRLSYEPVAKIIGKKLFWNSSFYVNHNVLDPRPETEVLIESVSSKIGKTRNILDLGTGTGCVAISLALAFNNIKVVASDISPKALQIAKMNAQNNKAIVQFVLSDWLNSIKEKFDIIVSNPPYISEEGFKSLPLDVKNYDPRIALFGGVDGLDCYRHIASSISYNLKDEGLGFFEIGQGQKESLLDIFSLSGLSLVDTWRDLSGLERVICVKKDA